jgi:hypothetical protein
MEQSMSREDQAYWAKHIEQYKSSGLKYKTYCAQEGVDYNRFLYRYNKASKPKSAQRLIPVSLKTQLSSPPALCSIELCNGHRLHVHDEVVLEKILRSLS